MVLFEGLIGEHFIATIIIYIFLYYVLTILFMIKNEQLMKSLQICYVP